jgi:DNA-binding winged helix-turn-helix (wHTH) protein/tetratricopeptide (TPR) repeat protein
MKQFHSFRLDPINQCLWRGDQRVPITPKAFDVLRYLVEHPGRLVTQEEILEAVWPETYVNQEVVKKYILGIRKVLGDSHDKPIFIETLHRRGYQFIAQVEDYSAASPALPLDAQNRMVGRGPALKSLDRALERACRGQRQLVFVTGEAGIGKTTLVDVFQQQAARHSSLRIARGQCVESFGSREAYYPMLEALGQLTRGVDRGTIVQTLVQRAPTWLIQFPALVKTEQREALQREILGATRERMVREICEALEVLTAEQPLVLVIEDLHWFDLSTLDLISALARRRTPAKLLVVCTFRPSNVARSQSPLKALKQDLQVHQFCEEIALERLEESAIAQFLASQFERGNVPSDLANLIHRHSGGNALFMVTIVEDMVKKGLIAQDNGGWRLTTPTEEIDPGVPETLQRMLEVQLDQLSEQEQRILKSASVAGDRFSVWAITTTLGIESEQIEDLCEGLAERQQFIKSTGIEELADGVVSAHYEFRHSLYRQAIYQRLSDVSRSRLHRGLGGRLTSLCTSREREQELASELAMHFERGRDYEQAIRYLRLSGENAARRFAYRDAIQLWRQALKLVPKVSASVGAELEIQILECIGDAHYALGAMTDSAKAYTAGAARAAQVGLKATQVDALICLMRPFGLMDPDQGIAAIDVAEQVSSGLNDPLLLARTQMLAAATRLLYDSWRKEDAHLCLSAHQMIRDLRDSNTPPYHQMMYAYVQVQQGSYHEALKIFESFIPKMDEPATYLFAVTGRTVPLLYLGKFGEVLRIVRAGKEMAERNGNAAWLFNFREVWLRTLCFDFAGARQLCEFIMRANAETPSGQPEAIARVAAAYTELDQRNYGQAIEYFRQVCDAQITPKFFQHWFWRMMAHLGLSNVWMECGDVAKARTEADIFLEFSLSTPNPYLLALAWEIKSRIAIAEQESNLAQEYIGRALAILEEFEIPVAGWQVHATARSINLRVNDNKTAETHRERAEAYILAIANSFPPDEPLRQSFLAAAPVRRILSTRQIRNTSLRA